MMMPIRADTSTRQRSRSRQTSQVISAAPSTKSVTAMVASGTVGPPSGSPYMAWESRWGVQSRRKWLPKAAGQASHGLPVARPMAAPANM